MKFAYADPPYLGKGAKFYGELHDQAADWDSLDRHQALIDQLVGDYPDGWALSCSTPSLRHLLPMCPDDTRVGAWVKPFHVFKKGVRPAYAWEPVLFRGGHNTSPDTPEKGGTATTPRDWVSAGITLQRGLTGAKPESFCRWVLDILGYRDGDQLDDLFPGSGIMGHVLAQGVLA